MPSERFYNLPDEKRERIIRAVHEEMSRVPFDELSINKIIQKAEIPRGSFYQYFEDKEDLLSFMMEDFWNAVYKVAKETLMEVKGDIFEAFFYLLKTMVEVGEQGHHCDMLKNISFGMKINTIVNAKFIQMGDDERNIEIYEMVDKSHLNINSMEDFQEVESMLAMLILSAGMEIFLDLSKKEEILNRAERRINMIKNGVLKE